MKKLFLHISFTLLLCACRKDGTTQSFITTGTGFYYITTNKAAYAPGETVLFTLNAMPSTAFVRYRYLNEIVSDVSLTGTSWNWQTPSIDFRGYSVEVYTKEPAGEITQAGIAVDVSSNWSRFPRYGFLSDFGQKTTGQMDTVIASLNRYHINGLQFYDWQDKHHQPLAGTVGSPANNWKDIANRKNYKSTVQGYIERAHQSGMQAMSYNLCYGSLSDAAADGVQDQWYMYRDTSHISKDYITLPKPLFKSDIFFLDPSNAGWQQYLANKNNDLYQVFNFDGYHVDQLGDLNKTLYNYNGTSINLAASFQSFLNAMKSAHHSRKLIMNAVNQYGQEVSIATAPVDFLYTEVWTGNEGYKDLAAIIQNNLGYSGGKSTVLAAYPNYNKAENAGTFNMPGVLLANAVIFAFGGSHIELGEHMLGKEYFPNSNLQMSDDLKKAMIAYYDFLTAYENLLRDGGTFISPTISCTNGKMSLGAWPPQTGKVAVQGKIVGSRQIVQLINFANANSFDWRDTNGNQHTPNTITDAQLQVSVSNTVAKVWVASPDINFGIPKQITFTQTGNILQFTLPQLKYWDMVVIE